MKQLEPHETARRGDWFFVFGGTGWIRLDAPTMPFYRMTIREADESNKSPHFPIVIMRPNKLEKVLRIQPNMKPNQHQIRRRSKT